MILKPKYFISSNVPECSNNVSINLSGNGFCVSYWVGEVSSKENIYSYWRKVRVIVGSRHEVIKLTIEEDTGTASSKRVFLDRINPITVS